MSSFKRKTTASAQELLLGTKQCQYTSSSLLTSSGIPSLDDVLGGGIQLGTSLLILNPDPHSSHANLVQKYFIAQGLYFNHPVHVFGDDVDDLVSTCMWTPGTTSSVQPPVSPEDDDETNNDHDKVKIAWRYEKMSKFKTTVSSQSSTQDDFCPAFDLSCRIPSSVLNQLKANGILTIHDIVQMDGCPYERVLFHIKALLDKLYKTASVKPVVSRIALPCFAGPTWGEAIPHKILHFLHNLRSLLRRHPYACVSLSLPSHLSQDEAVHQGWTQKLGWLSDACISLDAASSDPMTAAVFPSHHGLLRIINLPRVNALVPASDRASTLRGLFSASSARVSGGAGENNLAFKCTRKRLVFETFHLDVEGGVGERRTTPSTTSIITDDPKLHTPTHDSNVDRVGQAGTQIEVEATIDGGARVIEGQTPAMIDTEAETRKAPRAKAKRKVGFQMDRPDVYDF